MRGLTMLRAIAPMTPRFTPAMYNGMRSTYGVRFNSTAKGEEAKAEETAETAESAKSDASEPSEDPVITDLKAKLSQKDKQLADFKNHYAKAIADFRNLQDSTKKEIQKAKDFALQKFAKDLIVSLDNFQLALQSVKEDTLKTNEEVKNLYDGVEMTRSVFERTLTNHGIEKIDPVGEPFDPNTHEAAFEIPQPDKEPGTVFHVQQPGYTLNSRVLRPAKVGIVKGE
ncbi:grpE protein homolog, mitochondrial [[Candida] jaroonii]|uniref:GrpE protein homolog, mitochondrial n=1 Tax=[Candida] jaroonii TaxID=467808 RepID=A0ACA9Y780_9ASCO|nr:grpE protein homolog, mitochondrial [[Candida] jaroonii]